MAAYSFHAAAREENEQVPQSWIPQTMDNSTAPLEPWIADMLNEGFVPTSPISNSPQDLAQLPSSAIPNDPISTDPSFWASFNAELCDAFSTPSSSSAMTSTPPTGDFDFDMQQALPEMSSFTAETFSFQQPAQQSCLNSEQLCAPNPLGSNPLVPQDDTTVIFQEVETAFKDLARARAAADPRRVSRKQKQRDASIALYLERLRDTCDYAIKAQQQRSGHVSPASSFECAQPMTWQPSSASASDTSFLDTNSFSTYSSPESSASSLLDFSFSAAPQAAAPAPTPTPIVSQRASPPTAGGVEIVMDLNMNVATTLPRKHRPRTVDQRERYIAVRTQGACAKHKKQHKRCTCIDKMTKLSRHVTAVETNAKKHPSLSARATHTNHPVVPDLHRKKNHDLATATRPVTTTPYTSGADSIGGLVCSVCGRADRSCSCFCQRPIDEHDSYSNRHALPAVFVRHSLGGHLDEARRSPVSGDVDSDAGLASAVSSNISYTIHGPPDPSPPPRTNVQKGDCSHVNSSHEPLLKESVGEQLHASRIPRSMTHWQETGLSFCEHPSIAAGGSFLQVAIHCLSWQSMIRAFQFLGYLISRDICNVFAKATDAAESSLVDLAPTISHLGTNVALYTIPVISTIIGSYSSLRVCYSPIEKSTRNHQWTNDFFLWLVIWATALLLARPGQL